MYTKSGYMSQVEDDITTAFEAVVESYGEDVAEMSLKDLRDEIDNNMPDIESLKNELGEEGIEEYLDLYNKNVNRILRRLRED